MKNKLLDERSVAPFIARVQSLAPGAKCIWGSLTPGGMLFHCTKVNNEILVQKEVQKPTLKNRLIKPLLYVLKELPKGVKTNPDYIAKDPVQLNFETEILRFIESLNRFAFFSDSIQGSHPFFGPLHTKEWRRFAWLHTDHHLRQFGV